MDLALSTSLMKHFVGVSELPLSEQAVNRVVNAPDSAGCNAFSKALQLVPIIAKQHGGTDEASNLSFACIHCNRYKGPNIAGIDPDTGELTRLIPSANGRLAQALRLERRGDPAARHRPRDPERSIHERSRVALGAIQSDS